MRKDFEVSAGAVLLLAALLFFCGWRELLILLLCCAAHELGHLLSLWALGCPVIGFALESTGARIEYAGETGTAGEIAAALAGPAAGMVLAVVMAAVGTEEALRAAGVSMALSIFNLLPVPQLDGGRVLTLTAGERAAEVCGVCICVILLLAGLFLIAAGAGAWLFIAGIWLLLWQAGL